MKTHFLLRDTFHSKSTKYGRPFSLPNIVNQIWYFFYQIKCFWIEHEKILISMWKLFC
jgi:hypothetical protein